MTTTFVTVAIIIGGILVAIPAIMNWNRIYTTIDNAIKSLIQQGAYTLKYVNNQVTDYIMYLNITYNNQAVQGYYLVDQEEVEDPETGDTGYKNVPRAAVSYLELQEAMNRTNVALGLTKVDSKNLLPYLEEQGVADDIKGYTINSNNKNMVLQYIDGSGKSYLDYNWVNNYTIALQKVGAFQEDDGEDLTIYLEQFHKYDFTGTTIPFPSQFNSPFKEITDYYNAKYGENCFDLDNAYINFAYQPSALSDYAIGARVKKYVLNVTPNIGRMDWFSRIGLVNSNMPVPVGTRITQYVTDDRGYSYHYEVEIDNNGKYTFQERRKDMVDFFPGSINEATDITGPIYFYDNMIKGILFHNRTGIDKQETAVLPDTEEKARDLAIPYPEWVRRALKDIRGNKLGLEVGAGADIDTQPDAQDGIIGEDSVPDINEDIVSPSIPDVKVDPEVIPDPSTPTPQIPDPNPELPTITPTPGLPSGYNALGSKMFTMYKPSKTTLNEMAEWLWDSDLNKFEVWGKLLNNPMDAIISLKQLYCNIHTSHTSNMKIAAQNVVDAQGVQVQCAVIDQQYVTLDCGSVDVKEFYQSVLDYDYTNLEIWLPFIGFKTLDIKDVMSDTTSKIGVKYNIDVATGTCVANITITKDGVSQVLYSFEGNCATEIPLTGSRNMTLVGGVMGAAGGLAGGAMAGSFLGPVGSAIGGALGAVTGGISGMAGKNQISKSGGFSGNGGCLAILKPYLVINRPIQYNAANYNIFYGYPNNYTTYLSKCTGFTVVKDIHIKGIMCTETELQEIERMLKNGFEV